MFLKLKIAQRPLSKFVSTPESSPAGAGQSASSSMPARCPPGLARGDPRRFLGHLNRRRTISHGSGAPLLATEWGIEVCGGAGAPPPGDTSRHAQRPAPLAFAEIGASRIATLRHGVHRFPRPRNHIKFPWLGFGNEHAGPCPALGPLCHPIQPDADRPTLVQLGLTPSSSTGAWHFLRRLMERWRSGDLKGVHQN